MTLHWDGHRVGLNPEFADACDDCIGPLNHEFTVAYGLRSIELQARLHDAYVADPLHAPRAAPPGSSAHNFGLAIDLQLWVNGKMVWDITHNGWHELFAAVNAHPLLHGGWKFKSGPPDNDHVERVDWEQYKDWAAQIPVAT